MRAITASSMRRFRRNSSAYCSVKRAFYIIYTFMRQYVVVAETSRLREDCKFCRQARSGRQPRRNSSRQRGALGRPAIRHKCTSSIVPLLEKGYQDSIGTLSTEREPLSESASVFQLGNVGAGNGARASSPPLYAPSARWPLNCHR